MLMIARPASELLAMTSTASTQAPLTCQTVPAPAPASASESASESVLVQKSVPAKPQVDFAHLQQRFSAAALNYSREAVVQQDMGQVLLAQLEQSGALAQLSSVVQAQGRALRILEIGCGPGNFTQMLCALLQEHGISLQLCLNDISAAMLAVCVQQLRAPVAQCICGNILEHATLEQALLWGPFDLIISNATFQWFPELAPALQQLQALLSVDGVLAYSSFLEGTFAELYQLLGYQLSYVHLEQVEAALQQSDLSHVYTLEDRVVRQHFAHAYQLFHHLKATGVNALSADVVGLPAGPSAAYVKMGAGRMRALMREYERSFVDENRGGVYLTWRPYFCICMATKKARAVRTAQISL